MLGKLLKYDLKWDYKIIWIFYVLTILFCSVTRGLQGLGEKTFIFGFLYGFFTVVSYILIINVLINTFIRLIMRFIKNVYKDEAYLTHTLPVEKKKIYLSKFISSMICMFTSFVVMIIGLCILLYSPANIEALKQMIESAAISFDTNIGMILTIFAFTIFLEMALFLLMIYTAVIIGHKSENNKVGKSIVWAVVFFYLTQIGILLFCFLIGIWNQDIVNIFITSQIPSIETIKSILIIAIMAYALSTVIYYIVGMKQLKKGVNIE